MENKKPVYKKHDFLAPNKVVAIMAYLLCLFVISSLLFYLVAFIYSKITNVEYNLIIESLTNKNEEIEFSKEVMNGNYICQGITNFITYLSALIFVIFYMRDDLKLDFKNKSKKLIWLIPVTSIAFVAINYGIDKLFAMFVNDSTNQNTIENIMKTPGGAIPIIIAVVIFAPFVEELIYRKCVFSYLKKYGIVVCYLVSMFLFALPHMLSTSSSITTWLIQLIPYLISGLLLAFIYHISGYNIYSTIVAHMLQNIVSTILVFYYLGFVF